MTALASAPSHFLDNLGFRILDKVLSCTLSRIPCKLSKKILDDMLEIVHVIQDLEISLSKRLEEGGARAVTIAKTRNGKDLPRLCPPLPVLTGFPSFSCLFR